MNRSPMSVAVLELARFVAASVSVFVLLTAGATQSLGDTGPAQAGPPADTSPQSQPVARQAAPAQPSAGMRLERQVLSPSGKLRIQYLRDRQKGLHQIALQDAHNPANATVLAQYKRNAWVVLSPNEEWVVLNTRDGAEAGAQLYHRVSLVPLKYEVPSDLRGNGAGLQDVVWQTYLNDTQQDPNTDRSHVTIDGISWEPDSHRLTLSVAPIPSQTDGDLPEPWTCTYEVASGQVQPTAAVAEGPSDNSSNPSDEPPASQVADEQTDGNAPTGAATDFDGEKFPATRQERITISDANELDLSDIRYAIDEMLARHGANFKNEKTRKTFSEFSWYQPRTDVSMDEIEGEFSDIEKANIAVLRRCRDAKVAAAHRPERHAIKGEPVESDGQRALRGFLQGVSDALNPGN